ncbi:MAG: methyltransferase type 12, partial [Candidatus Eremiobacteraeota bacterium]|nr:methyltransferase type 12 [Candidatus Eremiobacteraeota bacterium]
MTGKEITLKEKVRKFWDEDPCGSFGVEYEKGSLEFFEQIEEHRYQVEPFIHSVAQFSRWRGKKVLEVGCSLGTDLLQFARAGADVYGLDLA